MVLLFFLPNTAVSIVTSLTCLMEYREHSIPKYTLINISQENTFCPTLENHTIVPILRPKYT